MTNSFALYSKKIKMTGKQLFEANINIRLNDNDLNALRSEANKQRIPLSTYCRTILTKHLQ